MKSLILFFVTLSFVSSGAIACQPDPEEQSPSRVKSNFDGAQFVVTAYIIDVRKIRIPDPPPSKFDMALERTTFKVERSFKGKLKPGETFEIDSGRTSCSRGVRSWAPFFRPGQKRPPRSEYPKRWLIYYTPPPVLPDSPVQLPPFELSHSPLSSPVASASYDLKILKKSAENWSRSN